MGDSADPSKLLEALAALAMLAKDPSQGSDSASGCAIVGSQVRQVVPALLLSRDLDEVATRVVKDGRRYWTHVGWVLREPDTETS
jgi:hypothetical protein